MITKLNQWRIFCETENQWVYEWVDATVEIPPLVCFTNSSHTVNINSYSIVDKLDSSELVLKEEHTKTQGNFRTEAFQLDIPAQSEYIGNISFQYPINLLAVWFNVTTDNVGDKLTVAFQPPYTGTLAANITTATTSVQVDLMTANILNIGYKLILKRISDNYTENLGEVLNINKTTGVVTVSVATSGTFSIGDNIKLHITGVKNLNLASIGRHCIGTSKIGATFIMLGGVFYAYYTNNTPSVSKKFYYDLEYLY